MSKDKLNKNTLKNKITITETKQSLSIRKSLIPSPEELKGYENVERGLASRIVAMAEKQQDNRLKIETEESKSFQKLQERIVMGKIIYEAIGLIVGGILAFTGIAGAIYLLRVEQKIEGYTTLVATIVSLFLSKYIGQEKNKDK